MKPFPEQGPAAVLHCIMYCVRAPHSSLRIHVIFSIKIICFELTGVGPRTGDVQLSIAKSKARWLWVATGRASIAISKSSSGLTAALEKPVQTFVEENLTRWLL